jgi:predicted dehydrogenase
VLDKPMTFTLDEAKELKKIIGKTGKYFCLTHTYTGYPMVKEARYQVQQGRLGKIKKVIAAYPQGWLTKSLEKTDYKQAQWRTDPTRSGIAGAMGDIGTHAFNLAEYVSGLQVTKLCADIRTVVEGRHLDDDGQVFVKFNNGAGGLIYASQIMAGEENDVSIKVYGDEGGLEWKQSDNNSLLLKWLEKPTEILRAGGNIPYLSSFAKHNIRTPAGHPEGYLEAFANHYRNFVLSVKASMNGEKPKKEWLDFPGAEDGVRGMAFIENVIASGKSNEKWMDFNV